MTDHDALRERAREVLDPALFAYFAGGSGREATLALESRAWDEVLLRPRVLRDVSRVDPATTLLGTPVALPVAVAPVASQRAVHPDGEAGVAAAVRAAGGLVVLSMRAGSRVEDVAAAAGPFWQQLYVLRDRGVTDEVARRAAAAGARALVVTVDTPVVARKTSSLPAQPEGVVEALDGRDPADPRLQQAADLTARDLEHLADLTGLPVVAKGVLSGAAARACVDAGARAVVVSTHGGRQLDGAVPTPRVLAEVVAAVGERAEVYVDGGVRSGVDVLRALALGARATLVGRPVVWALATGGSDGVRTLLEDLAGEVREALALAGCVACDDVGPDLLAPP